VALAGLAGLTPLAWQPAFCQPAGRLENVFRASPFLPAELRRVAMLPLSSEGSSATLQEGCEMLQPVLLAELNKTKKFEIVSVNHDDLRKLTGRLNWTGSETLPPDFFDSLQRVYGCDAVLFCEVTEFRAYGTLAVGWRLKLVNARTRQIVWAADEIFDAAGQTVAGAHHYQTLMHEIFPTVAGTEEAWLKANSPRRFGELTAARLLATLPDRQEKAKVSR
jgi:hypothetical protein